MAQVTAKTVHQKREEAYAAPQYTVSFHLVKKWKDSEELKLKRKQKWTSVDKTSEEPKHQTEWCAEAKKFRCTRCGKRQQLYETTRKMLRAKVLVKKIEKMEKTTFGRTRYGKKNGQGGRSSDLVETMFGPCETENGTKIDELLQAGASGHGKC